jgi:Pyridoxamine 5''-phosphate oxidase.
MTLNKDGSPQVSVVWVGIENDEFVIGHMEMWQKVKNIQRDNRVILSFLGSNKDKLGLQEYVVVHGEARITEGGAADLLQKLAHIYLGPNIDFPPEPYRSNPGYITRLKPRRITGNGPWNESNA